MRRHQQGYTFAEVIVAIAILIMLAGLTFALMEPSRQKAREQGCIAYLKQIHQAALMYGSDNGEEELPGFGPFPVGAFRNKGIDPYINNKEIFYAPGTPNWFKKKNRSSYNMRVVALSEPDGVPGGKQQFLSQIRDQKGRWVYIECGLYDEMYYRPREKDIDFSIRQPYFIDLHLDGSVTAGRRKGLPPTILQGL